MNVCVHVCIYLYVFMYLKHKICILTKTSHSVILRDIYDPFFLVFHPLENLAFFSIKDGQVKVKYLKNIKNVL